MLAAREKRSEFERQALVHTDALFGAAYPLTRNARDAEDLVEVRHTLRQLVNVKGD